MIVFEPLLIPLSLVLLTLLRVGVAFGNDMLLLHYVLSKSQHSFSSLEFERELLEEIQHTEMGGSCTRMHTHMRTMHTLSCVSVILK